MLYNQNWDKTEQVSLAGFIAWLGQQEPAGQYGYWDYDCCPIAQYAASIGLNYFDVIDCTAAIYETTIGWNCRITAPHPWTFAAALERARRFAEASQP